MYWKFYVFCVENHHFSVVERNTMSYINFSSGNDFSHRNRTFFSPMKNVDFSAISGFTVGNTRWTLITISDVGRPSVVQMFFSRLSSELIVPKLPICELSLGSSVYSDLIKIVHFFRPLCSSTKCRTFVPCQRNCESNLAYVSVHLSCVLCHSVLRSSRV